MELLVSQVLQLFEQKPPTKKKKEKQQRWDQTKKTQLPLPLLTP